MCPPKRQQLAEADARRKLVDTAREAAKRVPNTTHVMSDEIAAQQHRDNLATASRPLTGEARRDISHILRRHALEHLQQTVDEISRSNDSMLAITERWVCCDHPECTKLPSDECARRPGEEGLKRPQEECAEHHKTEKRVKASEKRVTIKRPKTKIAS